MTNPELDGALRQQAEWLGGAKTLEPRITKREAFAMAAMQGFLSNPHNGSEEAPEIASWSVTQADALLEALKETP